MFGGDQAAGKWRDHHHPEGADRDVIVGQKQSSTFATFNATVELYCCDDASRKLTVFIEHLPCRGGTTW